MADKDKLYQRYLELTGKKPTQEPLPEGTAPKAQRQQKTKVAKEGKPDYYIPPEDVDFSNVDMSKMQLTPPPEPNILDVNVPQKVVVSKKPLKEEQKQIFKGIMDSEDELQKEADDIYDKFKDVPGADILGMQRMVYESRGLQAPSKYTQVADPVGEGIKKLVKGTVSQYYETPRALMEGKFNEALDKYKGFADVISGTGEVVGVPFDFLMDLADTAPKPLDTPVIQTPAEWMKVLFNGIGEIGKIPSEASFMAFENITGTQVSPETKKKVNDAFGTFAQFVAPVILHGIRTKFKGIEPETLDLNNPIIKDRIKPIIENTFQGLDEAGFDVGNVIRIGEPKTQILDNALKYYEDKISAFKSAGKEVPKRLMDEYKQTAQEYIDHVKSGGDQISVRTEQPTGYAPTVFRGKIPGGLPVDEGMRGKGTYYSSDLEYASQYSYDFKTNQQYPVEVGEAILKNPYRGDPRDLPEVRDFSNKEFAKVEAGKLSYEKYLDNVSKKMRDVLEAKGYDGVIHGEPGQKITTGLGDEFVMFEPNKSIRQIGKLTPEDIAEFKRKRDAILDDANNNNLSVEETKQAILNLQYEYSKKLYPKIFDLDKLDKRFITEEVTPESLQRELDNRRSELTAEQIYDTEGLIQKLKNQELIGKPIEVANKETLKVAEKDIANQLKTRNKAIQQLIKEGAETTRNNIDMRVAELEGQKVKPNTVTPTESTGATPPPISQGLDPAGLNTGMKPRGFFERMRRRIKRELGGEVYNNIARNPENYYEPQVLKDIKTKLKDMTDEELIENMSDNALSTLPLKPSNSNIYILKELERYNRAIARGDKVSAENILEGMNQLGTPLGQLIRQYGEMKSSTPAGVMSLLNKKLLESKRMLSPEMKAQVFDVASEYFKKLAELNEADRIAKRDFTPENVGRTLDLAEQTAKEMKKLNDMMYRVTPRNIWDVASSILKGNLLTFMSIFQNPVANFMLSIPRFTAKVAGTIPDIIISKLTGDPRTIAHGPDLTLNFFKDFGKEFLDATKKIWTGDLGTDIGRKFELKQNFRPITSLRQFLSGKGLPLTEKGKVSVLDRVERLIEGVFGILPEFNFRLLNLGDQPFSKPTFKGTLREIAKTKGLKGQALDYFLKYPDELSRKLAEDESLEAVFTQDNTLADAVVKGKYAIGKMPVLGKPLRFLAENIAPYVKVPANFVMEITDFMVPAISMGKAVYNYKIGKIRRANMMFGKAITGMVMLKLTDTLINEGLITPSPETIDKERRLQYMQAPPNSINIDGLWRLMTTGNYIKEQDDRWWDYTKLGIFGAFFGVRSDMRQGDKDTNDGLMNNIFDTTIGTLTNYPQLFKYAFDQSFLKGTNSFLKTLASGKPNEWNNYFFDLFETASSVALPNNFKTIARTQIRYIPDKTGLDAMKKLDLLIKERMFWNPDLIEEYPVKVDLLGNKVLQTPKGENAYFYHMFDLAKGKTIEDSPVAAEIYRLWKATDDNDVVPSVPKKKIIIGNETVELNGRQYEKLQIYVGKGREYLLKKAVISQDYMSLPDTQKVSALQKIYEQGYNAGREKFINEEFGKSDKKKKRLFKEPGENNLFNPNKKLFKDENQIYIPSIE